MNNYRIIYSLDAFPISNNRWGLGNKFKETIYMTALSVLYSHLWYDDIELYVDETAYKFLYMLPCNVTKIDTNTDVEIWMKSKIKSIEKQTKPFIHVDTDVFIIKKINFDFDKVIIERNDTEYYSHYKSQLDFFNQYTEDVDFWNENLGYSFNCGIVGFRDLELRDQYVNAYYEIEKIFIKNRETYSLTVPKKYEPCIVLEQYTLASLLDYKDIKPTLLLEKQNLAENSKKAYNIGYNHIYGGKKYRSDIVGEIEFRLFKIFPYWYSQIKKALQQENYAI